LPKVKSVCVVRADHRLVEGTHILELREQLPVFIQVNVDVELRAL